MWGGRFSSGPSAAFRALNDSLRFDWRLVFDDIAGSIAWSRALATAGVLTDGDASRIARALVAIAESVEPSAIASSGEEDIHSYVEARLIEREGDLGKRLHTGRSRNDQVGTDLRLWTRRACAERIAELRAAQTSLLARARADGDCLFPGYTHLQPAQPLVFGHWCLAHFEALDRDAARLRAAFERAGDCPLGSGALAGTAFPIDRTALARSLGFDRPCANSLDAVSDRDYIVETLAACALCAVHLSRLAEDLIVYSSAEFGLLSLSDDVASGSSLMPQKKNPDSLELFRGKAGRMLGALVSVLTTIKALPLAYNKDLQEDKEPLFDAMDSLSLCLRVAPAVFDGMTLDRARCERASNAGYSTATELADHLVERGVPFRDAHEVVGRVVRTAIEKGVTLDRLSASDLAALSPAFGPDAAQWATPARAVARRDALGGTSPRRVAGAVEEASSRLSESIAADPKAVDPLSFIRSLADQKGGAQ